MTIMISIPQAEPPSMFVQRNFPDYLGHILETMPMDVLQEKLQDLVPPQQKELTPEEDAAFDEEIGKAVSYFNGCESDDDLQDVDDFLEEMQTSGVIK